MLSSMSLMLWRPSAVWVILATASSGDKSGWKKCSHSNERVPQFSASAAGGAVVVAPCSWPSASEVDKKVTIFLLLVTLSRGEIDALIIGDERLG